MLYKGLPGSLFGVIRVTVSSHVDVTLCEWTMGNALDVVVHQSTSDNVKLSELVSSREMNCISKITAKCIGLPAIKVLKVGIKSKVRFNTTFWWMVRVRMLELMRHNYFGVYDSDRNRMANQVVAFTSLLGKGNFIFNLRTC